MIVDSHIHLFRHGYTGFASASPLGALSDVDAYEQMRVSHGIAGALVICHEEQIDPDNNAFVRGLVPRHPWLASLAYVPSTATFDLPALERLLAAGHIGISLHLPDAAAADRILAWPGALWERLSRARALISLNARPEATARLAPLVEQAAECAILFAHLGLPGRAEEVPTPAAAAARLAPLLAFAQAPNVGVKLSGLYAIDPHPPHRTAMPYVEAVLAHFPATSLHWGSDFSPVLDFVRFEDTLLAPVVAQLAPADRSLVMGEALAARIAAARSRQP